MTGSRRKVTCHDAGALLAAAALFAVPLSGQRGASDSARIGRIIAGLRNDGFTRAMVVGHGGGQADALFVLSATTHGDSGVLVVTLESGAPVGPPVVLERARTPADLGVRSVQITPFLGSRELLDVEVVHQPFLLESSRIFSTHHVLRRQADALSSVCDLEGGSSSSYSKGIGSNTTTREVAITKVPGTAVTFSVRTTAKTVQRHDREAAPTIDTTTNVKWFELPVVGACREVRAPKL